MIETTTLSVPSSILAMTRSRILLLALVLLIPLGTALAAEASTSPSLTFTKGAETDFQALLDRAPAGATITCTQANPLDISRALVLRKPVTLVDLKARLQPKVDSTSILIAEATGITLKGLELRGNYDTVSQDRRAPLIHVKQGGFLIERCKFFDGSKDGIMVTPDDNTADIIGGTIRDIEGSRMARDLVSLGGGNGGLRIRDVTVENISLKTGFLRGAVEVSDGSDHITVRHVYAEDAVYGIDVQDHGAVSKTTGGKCAPNTRVLIEDVTAVRCQHIIRTKNSPLGHTDLTLRGFTGRECTQPVRISHTTKVLIENLTIINEKKALEGPPIALNNDHQLTLRNATLKISADVPAALSASSCSEIQLDHVTSNGITIEKPGASPEVKEKRKEEKKKAASAQK